MALSAAHAPSLEKLLRSLKTQPLEPSIEALIGLLKRSQVKGDTCATATAHMLSHVVAASTWHNVDELLFNVNKVGGRLIRAAPREHVIANIVRRVLGLIRDEASEDRNADDLASEAASDAQGPVPPPMAGSTISKTIASRPAPNPLAQPPPLAAANTTSPLPVSGSLVKMFLLSLPASSTTASATGTSTPQLPRTSHQQAANMLALRSEVVDGIKEIVDEISQADDQIASFADLQIQPGDYVLAYNPGPTVERFLVQAAKKRRFTAMLAAPPAIRRPPPSRAQSHGTTVEPQSFAPLRRKLGALGVDTIVVASSGLMAYMPKVHRVVLCARCVFADGGILADGGCTMAARVAHAHARPVLVLSSVFKLSPEYSAVQGFDVELGAPSSRVSYQEGDAVEGMEVEDSVAEYVLPELVDIYITNLGCQTRRDLSNIVADHYKPEDTNLVFVPSEAR